MCLLILSDNDSWKKISDSHDGQYENYKAFLNNDSLFQNGKWFVGQMTYKCTLFLYLHDGARVTVISIAGYRCDISYNCYKYSDVLLW